MARERKPSGRRGSRGVNSFGRKPGNLRPRQRILILCEGGETEPNYLNCLKRELKLATVNVEISIEGLGYDPSALINDALRRIGDAERDKRAFDEVWCVFDREATHEQNTFAQAVGVAGKKRIRLAVSNPAFEYWFLLHFVETGRPFEDAQELTQELKKHIPKYEKKAIVFPLIFPYTGDAIDRAKRILAQRPDEKDEFPNPSTGVYRLVEMLNDISNFK
jgi:hypothetical protein